MCKKTVNVNGCEISVGDIRRREAKAKRTRRPLRGLYATAAEILHAREREEAQKGEARRARIAHRENGGRFRKPSLGGGLGTLQKRDKAKWEARERAKAAAATA